MKIIKPVPTSTMERRALLGRRLSHGILVSGAIVLLVAAIYASWAAVGSWLTNQNRYLVLEVIAPLSDPAFARITPSAAPARSQPGVTATARPRAPVRVHIPALNVTRSIIPVPPVADPETGALTRDVERLFRRGRKDLVGHWDGSALPGQAGNMILVGHNYGVGYSGVFVRLGRLKVGQKVYVTDESGETFTYRVQTVERVKWRRKDSTELRAHWEFLSPSGPERLTLVTCGGANIEPFPDRVYVVAEPIH